MLETSQPLKKLAKVYLPIIFCMVGLASCSANGDNTESTSVSNSYSYDVGYELGSSGSIGQMIFYGQSDNPTDACNFVLQMSVDGTTNDGIDWVSVDSKEFLKGCLDGVDVAHPDANWNQ